MNNEISGIGFWLDVNINENYTGVRNFNILSLFVCAQLRRPLYFAIQFINKLGSELLEVGRGYILTKDEDIIQLLLYNPCHIDPIYSVNSFKVSNYTKYLI